MRLLDPIYGNITMVGPLEDLIRTPAVQRLRDVRQSNIDSLSMPGISNVSRYEHCIGAAHLATRVGFRHQLTEVDAVVLQAAALLHDVFIAPFGHLVEEALRYVGVQFNHEEKASQLLQSGTRAEEELGGVDLQMYVGRQAGIRRWAERTFQFAAAEKLQIIFAAGRGRGPFGHCIAGDVDLDNLDNLTRMAFHMGLEVDRTLPVRVAEAMRECSEEGIVFSDIVRCMLEEWLHLRATVYRKFMLSREDFVGKVMLIFATVTAYRRNVLGPPQYAWRMTDRELIACLAGSRDPEIRQAIDAWLLSELWPLSDLLWMQGHAPSYAEVLAFGEALSEQLQRPCFCYRIADKRVRRLEVRTQGQVLAIGREPDRWLLGAAARSRSKPFSTDDSRRIRLAASEFFNTQCLGRADSEAEGETSELALF